MFSLGTNVTYKGQLYAVVKHDSKRIPTAKDPVPAYELKEVGKDTRITVLAGDPGLDKFYEPRKPKHRRDLVTHKMTYGKKK